MGTLVRSCIAFGAHTDISPLGCGSHLYSIAMSLSKSLILILKFMLAFSLGTPLYMSSCNCIIMSFSCHIEPYVGFLDFYYQPYILSLSHVYPSRTILYIFCSLIPYFYREGTFPRVSLSYTCVLALSIGMFRYLELVCLPIDTRLLLVCNYKALLFFFKLFKIYEKVQKYKNK